MPDKLKHIVVQPTIYYELKKRGQAADSISDVISGLLAGHPCIHDKEGKINVN
jgi:predicted CopG family antitoxin